MERIAEEPFQFYTRQTLTYLLGRKAGNLSELLTGLQEVPASSIYYHTHHFLEQHEFLSPEPPNDFAYWVTHILKEATLGEKIAGIDLRKYSWLKDIREDLIWLIEDSLRKNPESAFHRVPLGHEFYFMRAQSFVFPTHYIAKTLSDFCECLRHVSVYSIYYHVFESRLRVEEERNDFSIWLDDFLGESELAKAMNLLDPYTQTLDTLRRTLIRLVEIRLAQNEHD